MSDWIVAINKNFACAPWSIAYRGKDCSNAMNIAQLLNRYQFEDSDIRVYMVPEDFSNEKVLDFLDHVMEMWWREDEEWPGAPQKRGKGKRR